MRSSTILLCFMMLGCFRTIDTGPGGPGVPPPLVRDVGPRTDLGPWSRDTGPGPRDAGPIGFFDSGQSCLGCAFDSDCQQPRPGCGRAICVAGTCALRTGPCELETGCDQVDLTCTPDFMEVTARLGTDYEPHVDFDRVVLLVDERVVYHDTMLTNDGGRFDLGTARVGLRTDLRLEVVLYLGCDEVASRRLDVMVFDGTVTETFIINRDDP